MTKKLFIDSQIWLGLYSQLDDTLYVFETIQKILKNNITIGQDSLELVLTNQVIDEILRNRYNSIYEDNKQSATQNLIFQSTNIHLQIPTFFNEFGDSVKKIRKLEKELNNEISEINKNIEEKISSKDLKADQLIKSLTGMVSKENRYMVKDVYDKSIIRMNIGNPPGKDNSYGDALNWESILANVNDDIYFVSRDKDFWDDVKRKVPNSFLINEWEKKKKTNITFFYSLKEFIYESFPQIGKDIDNFLISKFLDELENSGSFFFTHEKISDLTPYINVLKSDDREVLKRIFHNNSQISSIINDPDVNDFYRKVFAIPETSSVSNYLESL
ncbi:PIN domain-containing protein [Apilactobacillus kunkeei]|uniref:PIN domain-containing protein n=1 Tax=Apilactobacillus kunkeei TaxID=148814 RepID=UPI0039E13C70